MYSHHFGLTQDPFSIAPDPHFLFMSERHREALAHLLYGVAGAKGSPGTGGGFVLLTGDIGTGKTTICRCFLEQLPAGCQVAYIFNPKLSVAELLQSICEEFHIAVVAPDMAAPLTPKPYIDALNAFLLRGHAAGHSSVLIIDEAQKLNAKVLEQLRLLTNLETSERKLLQIVLIGQPELRDLLARPELEQLAQRVIARFHLDALTEAESAQYIQHRMDVAGHTGRLPFDPQALQRIYRLARGVPRRINLLCGRALLGSWANGLHAVNRAVVDKAAAEVFGTGIALAGRRRTAVYAIGGLALLTGAALTGYLATQSIRLPAGPIASAATAAPMLPAVSALSPLPNASAPKPAFGTLQTTASKPETTAAPPLAGPVAEIDAVLQQLPNDLTTAWRELAPVWSLPITSGDPCQAAIEQQLQCYQTTQLAIPILRQLNRPGILTLQPVGGRPVYAVLTGLNDQTATLQAGGIQHTVRLVALGRVWQGAYATFWQPPRGYAEGLQGSRPSPAFHRLARQLSQLDGLPLPAASEPQTLDAALQSRVRAFQRARGLPTDGKPDPMTLMQLDSATRADMPRLQTNPR